VKDGTSQFQNFHANFHKFNALFSMRLSVRQGYHKFSARWVPKILMSAHKIASAFVDFSERYHKDGDEFLNHIVRVTGDETWVSFVNAETKEWSKQWMHTLTKQAGRV
jgi:hypothetical protein